MGSRPSARGALEAEDLQAVGGDSDANAADAEQGGGSELLGEARHHGTADDELKVQQPFDGGAGVYRWALIGMGFAADGDLDLGVVAGGLGELDGFGVADGEDQRVLEIVLDKRAQQAGRVAGGAAAGVVLAVGDDDWAGSG